MKKTPYERIMSKALKNGDCLEFTGSLKSGGYGQIYANGKPTVAHRFIWEYHNGPIPEGTTIHLRDDGRTEDNPCLLFQYGNHVRS